MRRIIAIALIILMFTPMISGCDAPSDTTEASGLKPLAYTEAELSAIGAARREDIAASESEAVRSGMTLCDFYNLFGQTHYVQDVDSMAIKEPNTYGWTLDDGSMLMAIFEPAQSRKDFLSCLEAEGYAVDRDRDDGGASSPDESDLIIDRKIRLSRCAVAAFIEKGGERSMIFDLREGDTTVD